MKPFCRSLIAALALVLVAPALAVLPSTANRVDLVADGSGQAFAFTFKTLDNAHVEVFVGGVKQTSGFTVTRSANQDASPGGTVTFASPPAAQAVVRIQRTVPLTQGMSLPVGGAFPSKTVERAHDAQMMAVQQMQRQRGDDVAAQSARDDAQDATHAADKAAQELARASDLAAQDARDDGQDGRLTALDVEVASAGLGVQAWLASIAHPAGYVPAPGEFWILLGTADTSAPTVTAFSVPATSSSFAVPVSLFTAADDYEVTGYLVTESSSPPASNDSRWATAAPTTINAGGTGERTFYAWAKDAAGNVSSALSATCTVTVVDTTAPIVNAFSIPETSSSLIVPISTFTAVDDLAVSGYMAKESSATPAAGDAGWSSTPPTQFAFASEGAKALFAFAKDAAGNVSNAATDTTTITLPVNALLNPGFETQGAGDSTTAANWTYVKGTSGVAQRIGADGGVSPRGGSWMSKLGPYVSGGAGSAYVEQDNISGDAYRASAGDLVFWGYSTASIATTDTTRELFITAIAYDASSVQLGRVDIRVAGSLSATRDETQKQAWAAGSWVQRTIDLRTTLDASIGANLANVTRVRIYIRTSTVTNGDFTFYVDDVSF